MTKKEWKKHEEKVATKDIIDWFENVERSLKDVLRAVKGHKKLARRRIGAKRYPNNPDMSELKTAEDTLHAIDWAVNELQQINIRFDAAVRAAYRYSSVHEVKK